MRFIIESKVLNLVLKSVSILSAVKTIILQSCDVGNAPEDAVLVAAKEKGYCAASNSSMTSSSNRTGRPEIMNMHHFSQPGQNFNGRSGFGLSKFTGTISRVPVKKVALCPAHFDDIVLLILLAQSLPDT